ncbi:MAG: hypothetical protein ACTHWZ_02115 [Peptoniphilaceae bacterium]
MKKKIYDKKRFFYGIVFATMSIIYLLFVVFDHKLSEISIKNFIYLILLSCLSFFYINQALSPEIDKISKEDKEKEELIDFKASSLALKIINILSLILMFLFIFLWYKTKVQELLGMILSFGIIFNLSLFLPFFTYIYYHKKYK